MKKNSRETQKKIVRSLVKVWMKHRTMVVVALLAIVADIIGVCLVVNAAPALTLAQEENVVSYKEGPAPVANVAGYSDIFGDGATNSVASAKKATTINDDGSVVEEDAPTVLELNSSTKPGYMNNCYFLGDSRLVAMVSYGFVSDANVLAKIGVSHTAVENTTFQQNSGKQYTVKKYLETVKPPVVYICYGVNGMNGISEEKYEKSYKELVEHIIEWAPDSKIVLMSIWPVDDYGPYKNSVQNAWIEKYNDFLLALAEYEGIFYLDVASVLKDSNGQIKREFDGGDGLHYRASAYNTIIDYIYHHPVKGISDEGDFTVKYVKPTGEFKRIMTEQPKLPANVVEETPASVNEKEPEPSPTIIPTPTVIEQPKAKPTKVPEVEEEKPRPTLSPSPTPVKPEITEPTPTEPPVIDDPGTPDTPVEVPTVAPPKEEQEPDPEPEHPDPPKEEPTPEPEPEPEHNQEPAESAEE